MSNVNNSEFEQFLGSQPTENLWSEIPDTDAEIIGGGQIIPTDLISSFVGPGFTAGMNSAQTGLAAGSFFAEQGTAFGLEAANTLLPSVLPFASNMAQAGSSLALPFLQGLSGVPGVPTLPTVPGLSTLTF